MQTIIFSFNKQAYKINKNILRKTQKQMTCIPDRFVIVIHLATQSNHK